MQILNGIDHVPASARGAVLAIGNFDGVHRGHQALLQAAKTEAKARAALAGGTVVEPVAEGGEIFSSSAIRAELGLGDVRGAAEMLGHWWRVAGPVIGGAGRGKGLGFPTANIALERGTALAHGIYAVRVHLDGR